jgi:hypothetical protein
MVTKNLLDEISYNVKFVKGHTLQPVWYKGLKFFILLVVIGGFIWLFGWRRAIVFTVAFLLLSLLIHMTYRIKTRRFARNWMDFMIVEDKDKNIKQGIGLIYYIWVILNTMIAFIMSQVIIRI